MFQKCAFLIVVALVAIVGSGCAGTGGGGPFSSLHYGGEGLLAGGAAGGTTAAAITNGHPLWTAVGTISGALIGAIIGGQVRKDRGIAEADMGLDAKRKALLNQCRLDEWNRTEQAVRYSQVYGGKPADYYQPDYNSCDQGYGVPVQQVQPRNISQQPSQPTYTLQPNIQRH